MWQASVAANEKRSDRDKARTDASQGTFAASAMAMFKGFEEDAGADERVVSEPHFLSSFFFSSFGISCPPEYYCFFFLVSSLQITRYLLICF